MPAISTNDILYQATQDMHQVLQNPDTDCPLNPCTPQELTVIKDMVRILHKKLPNPDPLPPPPPQEKVVGPLQRVATNDKSSLTLKPHAKILKRPLPTPRTRCTLAQNQCLGKILSPSLPQLLHSQPLYPQSPILTAMPTLLLIAGSAMDCWATDQPPKEMAPRTRS